jgi:hypothetical protein
MTVRNSWHPEHALAQIEHAAEEAELRGAQVLLNAANRRVPKDTGALEASGHVDRREGGAAVVYSAEHARYVHAHPEWTFQQGRSGHWLEEAIETSDREINLAEADTMRAEWPS